MHIHILGICGTFMGSLAVLAKQLGYRVSGSDANVYPPMSTQLQEQGIDLMEGFRHEHLQPSPDLVVIGNALSRGNPAVEYTLSEGLNYMSGPQWLAQFVLHDKWVLGVAGTHGKTTTSAILAWILEYAGMKPGYLIGGVTKNFPQSAHIGDSAFFVVEADEYDSAFFDKRSKFVHYAPRTTILNNLEFDHADIYRDLDHIKDSFRKFVNIIHPDGFLLTAFSDEHAKDVLAGASCEVETYGFSPSADWVADDYKFENGEGHFTLSHKAATIATFHLPMIGRHNIENAAAVAAMGIKLGLTAQEVQKGFATFKGIKRRQEIVGIKNDVTVIDDFAHHPTAIKLTLEAVREAYPGQRLWAVFEPRSATCRRKIFENRMPQSFTPADRVIIAGLFAPDKIPPENRLDPKRVVECINENRGDAFFIPEVDALVDKMADECRPKDVFLIMSSGGFSGIHQKLLDRL